MRLDKPQQVSPRLGSEWPRPSLSVSQKAISGAGSWRFSTLVTEWPRILLKSRTFCSFQARVMSSQIPRYAGE